MPEPQAPSHEAPLALCRSEELAEKGRAHVFDVLHFRAPARAFVLRFDGCVVGYLNRCLHVPTEMDWLPGELLDSEREFIICSIHGASYDPRDGRCRYGPCGRGSLTKLDVIEQDGRIYWYPSRDTRPPASDGTAASPMPESSP